MGNTEIYLPFFRLNVRAIFSLYLKDGVGKRAMFGSFHYLISIFFL